MYIPAWNADISIDSDSTKRTNCFPEMSYNSICAIISGDGVLRINFPLVGLGKVQRSCSVLSSISKRQVQKRGFWYKTSPFVAKQVRVDSSPTSSVRSLAVSGNKGPCILPIPSIHCSCSTSKMPLVKVLEMKTFRYSPFHNKMESILSTTKTESNPYVLVNGWMGKVSPTDKSKSYNIFLSSFGELNSTMSPFTLMAPQ